ncbi:MAG: YciI family protein [Fibrella sp.]|nr:YciI family protein [Armatimonadota bacterium]
MNYMLLIYQEENTPGQTEDVHDDCVKTCEGLVDRLWASGQYVAAGILQPTATATSVRLREGNRIVTDGPFAETREQLAGYLMVEANTLDEAIAIAMQHPVAKTGTVEIRPVMEIPFLTPSGAMGNSNK